MLVRRKDPATVPRAAFEVLDSAEQAVGLINDLLDLSRLDEDRLRPVIREVDPASVTRRSIGRVTPAAAPKSVTLELQVAPGLSTCQTDANRLEQILVNLLGNAIRHTPERTTVRVQIANRDGRVAFHVQDAGPGVREEELEHVFDIYETKAGEESRGAGLGLPLSRRLARLLGGELRAMPPRDGGGFLLELPAGSV
jgi:signal transduction histidine kinase